MRDFMFNVERSGEETRKLSHNNDRCVGCGICTDVCPTSSLRLGPIVPIARGLIEMDLVSVTSNTCVLCGLCSVACPFDALSLTINGNDIKETGNYPVWEVESEINDDDCIYCGRCYSVCPRDTILFKRELPSREDLVIGEISVDEDKCVYCSICSEMCPAGAISLTNNPEFSNDNLNNTIEVDTSKCIYCGVCKRACPQDAIKAVCSTCMLQDQIKAPEINGTASILKDGCVNCSWCKEVCPVDTINVTKPFEGTLKLVETDESTCKGDACHACQDVCPCDAVGANDLTLDFFGEETFFFCDLSFEFCVFNIKASGVKLTSYLLR